MLSLFTCFFSLPFSATSEVNLSSGEVNDCSIPKNVHQPSGSGQSLVKRKLIIDSRLKGWCAKKDEIGSGNDPEKEKAARCILKIFKAPEDKYKFYMTSYRPNEKKEIESINKDVIVQGLLELLKNSLTVQEIVRVIGSSRKLEVFDLIKDQMCPILFKKFEEVEDVNDKAVILNSLMNYTIEGDDIGKIGAALQGMLPLVRNDIKHCRLLLDLIVLYVKTFNVSDSLILDALKILNELDEDRSNNDDFFNKNKSSFHAMKALILIDPNYVFKIQAKCRFVDGFFKDSELLDLKVAAVNKLLELIFEGENSDQNKTLFIKMKELIPDDEMKDLVTKFISGYIEKNKENLKTKDGLLGILYFVDLINDDSIKEAALGELVQNALTIVENVNTMSLALPFIEVVKLIKCNVAKKSVLDILLEKKFSLKIDHHKNTPKNTPNIAVLSNGGGLTTPYVIKNLASQNQNSVKAIDFTCPLDFNHAGLYSEVLKIFEYIDQNRVPGVSRAEKFITVAKDQKASFPIIFDIINKTSKVAHNLDCIVLPGGEDIPEIWYRKTENENSCSNYRTIVELALIHEARQRGIPIMGICRGHQIIQVYQGKELRTVGNKYNNQKFNLLDPSRRGLVAHLFKKEGIIGKRMHHQGVHISEWENGTGDLEVLSAADDLVYASESKHGAASPVITTQFHPEMKLAWDGNELSNSNQDFFKILYKSAKAYKVKKSSTASLLELYGQLKMIQESLYN